MPVSVLFTEAYLEPSAQKCLLAKWMSGWIEYTTTVLHTSGQLSFVSSPVTLQLSFLLPPAFSSLPHHTLQPCSQHLTNPLSSQFFRAPGPILQDICVHMLPPTGSPMVLQAEEPCLRPPPPPPAPTPTPPPTFATPVRLRS